MLDVHFSTLTARDVMEIQALPRHAVIFGQPARVSQEEAEVLAAAPIAWAARYDGGLIAAFGIVEHFAGQQGLGWTLLADRLGAAHLRLTRFVAAQIENCGLARLELMARGPDLEPILARMPDLDPGQVVELAMQAATREMRWALALGMRPAHLLRCWGADCESFMLFERLQPTCAKTQTDPSCLTAPAEAA